mgnify:CR=1 FL=1
MEQAEKKRGRAPGREYTKHLSMMMTPAGMAEVERLAEARAQTVSALIRALVREELVRRGNG